MGRDRRAPAGMGWRAFSGHGKISENCDDLHRGIVRTEVKSVLPTARRGGSGARSVFWGGTNPHGRSLPLSNRLAWLSRPAPWARTFSATPLSWPRESVADDR